MYKTTPSQLLLGFARIKATNPSLLQLGPLRPNLNVLHFHLNLSTATLSLSVKNPKIHTNGDFNSSILSERSSFHPDPSLLRCGSGTRGAYGATEAETNGVAVSGSCEVGLQGTETDHSLGTVASQGSR